MCITVERWLFCSLLLLPPLFLLFFLVFLFLHNIDRISVSNAYFGMVERHRLKKKLYRTLAFSRQDSNVARNASFCVDVSLSPVFTRFLPNIDFFSARQRQIV